MIVPLALLSGAWTLSLAGFGSATAAAHRTDKRKLPDGTQVPSQAIEAPASVPRAGVIAPGVPRGTANAVVDGASASGIPSAAVSAYQRAAQIINAADKGCHVPWELIAAIGRVESDHGRYGGNVLSDEGVSQPGIYGIALNGKNGTQAIQDTDGGVLDKDTVYDRAVGAMQFIPGTWSVVKVDADGDGKRNPQDIDDSSLATAVYLCSGNDDLGTRKGQEAGCLPLQPLQVVRRPGAPDHGRLPVRRLHRRPDRHLRGLGVLAEQLDHDAVREGQGEGQEEAAEATAAVIRGRRLQQQLGNGHHRRHRRGRSQARGGRRWRGPAPSPLRPCRRPRCRAPPPRPPSPRPGPRC